MLVQRSRSLKARLRTPPLMSTGDVGLNGVVERVEAELFTDGRNDAVVRLPGRRFPGVLIQGDSPHILRSDLADAWDSAGLLLAGLDALLTRYADALREHVIPRPY
ncbi:DUF6959 family protein [Streptomyces avermitilis]|uniref:DUF6959 family protein n=1 Tax=Streptomyces avermitilis TaxID=33903 RepID=UPI0033A3C58A